MKKLLELVEFKLKEAISREPTLLVMVIGVPNVGKSALINSIHQIASERFPGKAVSWNIMPISLYSEGYKYGCVWFRGLVFWTSVVSILFHSAGENEAS